MVRLGEIKPDDVRLTIVSVTCSEDSDLSVHPQSQDKSGKRQEYDADRNDATGNVIRIRKVGLDVRWRRKSAIGRNVRLHFEC